MFKDSNNELQNLIEASRISPFSEIAQSIPLLRIEDEVIATKGNFSCIIGKPKSRKTFLIVSIIAAILSEKKLFGSFTSDNENYTVLHFDTEQSRPDVQLTTKRIYRLLNISKSLFNYQTFSLRPFEPQTRLEMIEKIINTTNNVSLVVIDGIADLVTSYNDEAQASKISNKLLKWTADNNIHILTVIHENKDNNNAKGHLGSYILQKAETIIAVKKQYNSALSTVSCQYSRGKSFNSFSFLIDDNGLPFVVENKVNVNYESSIGKNPSDYNINSLNQIISKIFNENHSLSRAEFLTKIRYSLLDQGVTIGSNKSCEWLDYFKAKNLVSQDKDRGPYKLVKR